MAQANIAGLQGRAGERGSRDERKQEDDRTMHPANSSSPPAATSIKMLLWLNHSLISVYLLR